MKTSGGFFEIMIYLVGDLLVRGFSFSEHAQPSGELTPERHCVIPPPSGDALLQTPGGSSSPSEFQAASVPRE